jgi:hypothetical protein
MNIEKYKQDIKKLLDNGEMLYYAMVVEQYPERKKELPNERLLIKLPIFSDKYQQWYSEALACIEQLLPLRTEDFVQYYKPGKIRKDIAYDKYTVSDYLQNLTVTRGFVKEKVVGPEAAIPKFRQQINIVKSLLERFESTLFDLKTLVHADLLDDELDAAEELCNNGYFRASGAVAGVVLEAHLASVCTQRQIFSTKKNPSLSEYNDLLKKNSVIETPEWRQIQHLGDLRNLCDHKKTKDPTEEDIELLVNGVKKIIKNVF